MHYAVVFTPEAREQLAALYRYIAVAATPEIAERYTDAIVSYCEQLQSFPHRGTLRNDIRSGLRITNYKLQKTYRDRLRRECQVCIHHRCALRRTGLR